MASALPDFGITNSSDLGDMCWTPELVIHNVNQFCWNVQDVVVINIIIVNATCVIKKNIHYNKVSYYWLLFLILYLKEDRVKEKWRNSVTWLRIPDDSDSIVVNSQVTKNLLSAT